MLGLFITNETECLVAYQQYLHHYSKTEYNSYLFCTAFGYLRTNSSNAVALTPILDVPLAHRLQKQIKHPNLNTKRSVQFTEQPPNSYDQREQGLQTAVFDQGSCGSCYAIALMYAMESAVLRDIDSYSFSKNYSTNNLRLSAQQLLDKTVLNSKCNGGDAIALAYEVITSFKTVEFASNIPYKYGMSQADFIPIRDYQTIFGEQAKSFSKPDVDAIKNALAAGIPVLAAMGSMQGVDNAVYYRLLNYQGGILEGSCPDLVLDHQVLIVGYGTYKGVPVWVFKNSWGTSWGDHGYFYVRQLGDAFCSEHYAYFVVPTYMRDQGQFQPSAKLVKIYSNSVLRGKNGLDVDNTVVDPSYVTPTPLVWWKILAIVGGSVLGLSILVLAAVYVNKCARKRVGRGKAVL